MAGECWNQPKKDTPCLRAQEKLQQEATTRTGHGTTDWFKIGNGVCQGCILSPCLFNFYADYIIRNAGLDEAQVGIKIAKHKPCNTYQKKAGITIQILDAVDFKDIKSY